jgi:hypothetical protein
VTLGVYNAAGRRVATLADDTYSGGRHVLYWNARSALGSATGVYFLRAAVGDETEVSRLLIVR